MFKKLSANLVAFIFIAVCCQASNPVIWQLEDYNSWNLPFAKTVQISGRKGTDGYVGNHGHYLSTNSFLLEVDPSTLFSFIFVSNKTFTNYEESELVTLNYTFMGEVEMSTFEGVWTDVEITLYSNSSDPDSKRYTADITIFVAITDTPPDSGLQGSLSICITPGLEPWTEVSLMHQLTKEYELPKIYIAYKMEVKNGWTHGYIEFSEDENSVNNLTYGGQILLSNQIGDDNTLFSNKTVNPFLNIQLAQIKFKTIQLQNQQVYVSDFSDTISLITAEAGTHIPTTLWNYMKGQFFDPLCDQVGQEGNYSNQTSQVVPLMNCQCASDSYSGMPSLAFLLTVDQYQTQYEYVMDPKDFEMAPKIEKSTRVQKCNLGLWNLEDNEEEKKDYSSNTFAVGQNFIKKYGLTIMFVERAGTNDISLSVYIGNASPNPQILSKLIYMMLTLSLLLVYLGCFTIKKFRRVKVERVEFAKIKKGLVSVPAGNAKARLAQQNLEKEFLQGKEGGMPLKTLKQNIGCKIE